MSVSIHLTETIDDAGIAILSRRNPGYRFERSRDGRLIVAPTGSQGGARNAALATQLGTWSKHSRLGISFDSSTGFVLPDSSLLSPDGAWIRNERWNALSEAEREGYAPLCPDVVFEIRSRTDDVRPFEAKARSYIENGAKLVVLIDPYRKTVALLRPDRDDRFESPASVDCGPELPGFVLETQTLLN